MAALFPALLLLPTLHLHPAHDHAHGTYGAHQHAAVVHADFFPRADSDHAGHEKGQSGEDDHSPVPFSHISLPTILPRSFIPLIPVLEKTPIFFSAEGLVLASPFLFPTWISIGTHSPPFRNHSFPIVSPRSPPFLTSILSSSRLFLDAASCGGAPVGQAHRRMRSGKSSPCCGRFLPFAV